MTRPIFIYLDFDGVIYPYSSQYRRMGLQASKDAVAAINWLVEMYGARIVFSTTWRYMHSLTELTARIRSHGIKGEIADAWMTPGIYKARDVEIEAHMLEHPEAVGIVLDDDDDVRLLAKSKVADRCVVVHCSGNKGLRLRKVMKVPQVLESRGLLR